MQNLRGSVFLLFFLAILVTEGCEHNSNPVGASRGWQWKFSKLIVEFDSINCAITDSWSRSYFDGSGINYSSGSDTTLASLSATDAFRSSNQDTLISFSDNPVGLKWSSGYLDSNGNRVSITDSILVDSSSRTILYLSHDLSSSSGGPSNYNEQSEGFAFANVPYAIDQSGRLTSTVVPDTKNSYGFSHYSSTWQHSSNADQSRSNSGVTAVGLASTNTVLKIRTLP